MSEKAIKHANEKGYLMNLEVLKKVQKKKGYCPCRADKTKDSICPCKPERENDLCACGLFIKPTLKMRVLKGNRVKCEIGVKIGANEKKTGETIFKIKPIALPNGSVTIKFFEDKK